MLNREKERELEKFKQEQRTVLNSRFKIQRTQKAYKYLYGK